MSSTPEEKKRGIRVVLVRLYDGEESRVVLSKVFHDVGMSDPKVR